MYFLLSVPFIYGHLIAGLPQESRICSNTRYDTVCHRQLTALIVMVLLLCFLMCSHHDTDKLVLSMLGTELATSQRLFSVVLNVLETEQYCSVLSVV